ncbi:MAG: hypothetical protein JWM00_467 [Candidatus Saccharibacteria bacterium]|nr:hypothetical protein [Candidatus Saccharibacteria bacterium]
MPTLIDKEFGTITIRRSVKAQSVRMRVAPDGTLRISTPLYTPMLYIRRLIGTSRGQLRALLAQHQVAAIPLSDGMQIGKSHSLIVREGDRLQVERHGQHISVTLPPGMTLDEAATTTTVREAIIAALRIEAKSYLPKRLSYLAADLGYTYDKVRFSHASGRWGSCSSNGTISLNIALMKLPFELIDYVLVHELAHTQQMNHSPTFWELVARGDPQFKQHRKVLKSQTPSV